MNPKTALLTRKTAVIGLILTIALFGFELFNFDTTRFALSHLMGGRRFLGLEWVAVLALAFGSLDFAGLVRVFTPEKELRQESSEIWWLTDTWLIGATLNAMMTWYAMALLIAPLGVEIGATLFTHAQMLRYAPCLSPYLFGSPASPSLAAWRWPWNGWRWLAPGNGQVLPGREGR
jgi:hypothetical protein